ncbi:GNAT family N-acetyltransferase [Reichenbachiella carrageenanivorans]|uniref:GNAT family N-acetyltransferase n=1 Tax=Reichenbachiella carrageenanivorans TaxID=2979869 RepID=A0ABY6CW90_9BACT|nr:GNAT family N-acetyltransferase [Reichenbachiella carrageenanivorans]UXX78177.1 GNAT family N-acetyltransferase [Reichenbachiella carrageenanivorans]
MDSTPIITTERTNLHSPDTITLAQVRHLDSDPEILKYITGGKTRTKPESEHWLQTRLAEYHKNGFGLMPAYLKSDNSFIGWGGLKKLDNTDHIELGYRLDKPYWGKGLATEVAKGIVDYAKAHLAIDKLVAVTDLDNKASQQVLTKIGFSYLSEAFYYQTHVAYFEMSL